MASQEHLAIASTLGVFLLWIIVSGLYLRYSGLLVRYLKEHHPNINARDIPPGSYAYFISGYVRKWQYWSVLFTGAGDAQEDVELNRLLSISRLLALGCMIAMLSSIAMIASLPDFHIPPPPGYSGYR